MFTAAGTVRAAAAIPSFQTITQSLFLLFQHHDAHALGTPLLMGALILHGSVSAISGNVSAMRNAIAWLSRPRQMASARLWKKWLRLGEWWLRRRITSVSSQPIVFRQSRLRVLLPNGTTPVPCAAAKPALAHLLRRALALSTHERSADTLPTLARWNASPTITQRESAIGVPFFWRTGGRAM
jgi:hypothetical protein